MYQLFKTRDLDQRIAYIVYAAQFVKYFGKYGDITDSVIMRDRKTGQPRGFGFVTYADPSVVDKVIEETHIINGKQVCSNPLCVHIWICFVMTSFCA